jgi:CubicO group peptidase (beta-lactamase class C family)
MNKIKLIAMSLASFVAVHAVADEVEDVLARYIGTGCIAGVVSVTSDADYNVKTHCAGWADVEAKRPMRDDTLFAIFSMTKTFTGIALLTAVDDGKISLEDEVSKFLPEFADVKMSDGSKVKRAITVRDLMNHTTGWRGGEKVINRSIPLREVAKKLAAKPLSFQPGETFAYGNAWICSAAACLEVATGEKFEDYLKRRILDPLGMKDTTFTPDANQLSRLVKPYTSDAYPFRPGADACCEQLKFPKSSKIYPAASGGLFSTPRDVIAFSQMLAHHGEWKGTRILSRKTFDSVFSVKQTPSSIKEPYTVGAWIWGDWIGHEGAMRTDQRANIKTGHSRVFFIQTENAAGRAFFQLKNEWHRACDIVQKTPVTVFGT